ncbi:hypothetical protein L2E82_18886 [Cichorium intybus]|uniref:Uncharacterized protein n=1 Tax=Cichorium intybus TaxID=13427 RepID=A0ACB9FBN6_CICIN|nr:hypothetical protein L2E82_18886 [Cichorium intybus]
MAPKFSAMQVKVCCKKEPTVLSLLSSTSPSTPLQLHAFNDWEVVKRGWDAQVLGEASHKFKNVVEAVKTLRELQEYVEIQSDSGITFNVQPKMKALEIGEKARDAILSRRFHQVRLNIPNGDMVGHTGDVEATVVACKAADEAVKMIFDAVQQVGGIYVVTADHGNAVDWVKRKKKGEPAVDKDGNVQILTSYTLQPLPIAIGGPRLAAGVKFQKDVPSGGLLIRYWDTMKYYESEFVESEWEGETSSESDDKAFVVDHELDCSDSDQECSS